MSKKMSDDCENVRQRGTGKKTSKKIVINDNETQKRKIERTPVKRVEHQLITPKKALKNDNTPSDNKQKSDNDSLGGVLESINKQVQNSGENEKNIFKTPTKSPRKAASKSPSITQGKSSPTKVLAGSPVKAKVTESSDGWTT